MYKYTRKLQCFTEFYFKPPIYWKAANFAVRVTASKYFYLQQSAEKKEEKRKKMPIGWVVHMSPRCQIIIRQ